MKIKALSALVAALVLLLAMTHGETTERESATEPPQAAAQHTDAHSLTPAPDGIAGGPLAAENSENARPSTTQWQDWEPDEAEVAYIAKTIFGEASVVPSRARQAAVGWCILNRVDAPGFPDTVEEVVTAPYQFAGYREAANPPEEYFELARDILTRYHREQQGEAEVGRTLPRGWCFFTGDGKENYFTMEWRGTDNWSWALPDPYTAEEE